MDPQLINQFKYYILTSDGKPLLETDIQKWIGWFVCADRHIAYDRVGNSIISTIFLATARGEPPVLWETAVIGGLLDQVRDRCAGHREQAEAMHHKMVQRVREAQFK